MDKKSQIISIENAVFESLSHINQLNDLFKFIEDDETDIVVAGVNSIQKLFQYLLQEKDVIKLEISDSGKLLEQSDVSGDEAVLSNFLVKKFSIFLDALNRLLTQGAEVTLQILGMKGSIFITKVLFLHLNEKEGLEVARDKLVLLFGRIISSILISETTETTLLDSFVEKYIRKFRDVGLITLECLKSLIQVSQFRNPEMYRRFYHFMSVCPECEEVKDANYYARTSEEGQKIAHLYNQDTYESDWKLSFSSIAHSFLSNELGTKLLKKVLLDIHKVMIPQLENPLILADFLTDAYDFKDSLHVRMLALSGLFVLISKHNLDYPKYYQKLYGLLLPQEDNLHILNMKYRTRFLKLLELSLRSNQLPASLICAFIKRSMRIALQLPPNCIIWILPFVQNLFKRHPVCIKLIRKSPDKGTEEFETDPFKHLESDPEKSKATDSYMWELAILKRHYCPNIAKLAKNFEATIKNKNLLDLDDFSVVSLNDLFSDELEKTQKEAPMNFEAPNKFVQKNSAVELLYQMKRV